MDNVITFTPSELVAFITAIGGAIVTIGAVATLIFKLVNRIKAPEVEQNKRIKSLEDRVTSVEEKSELFTQYFVNDNNRFKAIEKANRITQSALLALLKHAISGEDIQGLKDAEKDLEKFLVSK